MIFNFNSDLPSWISTIKAQRILAGNLLFSSQDFTTDSGAPGTLLIWSTSQGAIYEAFVEQNSLIYALHSQLTLVDSALLDTQIRASFQSLCIQPQ